MRFTKSLVLVIVTMMVFSGLFILIPIGLDNIVQASHMEEYKVNLNFHEKDGSHFMNTSIPGDNSVGDYLTEISFELNPAFYEDLTALSIEEGIGFELLFYYAAYDSEVFVNVSHNSQIIAKQNKTLDNTVGDWESVDIAWTEEIEYYEFLKGESIIVDISFINSVYFSYNETDNQGRASRLTLKCQQVKSITVGTYELNPVSLSHIETNEYQPNMHENYSFIIVKGEIWDSFGEYDIGQVDVEVKDFNEEIINEGEISATFEYSYPINYTFIWNYSGKIYDDSENYNITVNVSDVQGNVFSNSKIFAVTKHGVFIETPPDKNIGQGQEVIIPIEIWNTGVSSDTITLTVDEPSGGWVIELDKYEILNIPAGDYKIVKATVSAPEDVNVGTSKIIGIKGTTGGEGSEIKEYDMSLSLIVKDIFEIDLFMENENGQRVEKMDLSAEVGLKTPFSYFIHNIGSTEDEVNLEIKGIPKDWKLTNDDSVVIGADKISTLKIEVEPAQSESAENIAKIKIIGTSKNDESKSDELELTITRTYGVFLKPDKINQTTNAGNKATFFIDVENTGNEERTYNLNSETPINWQAIAKHETVTLEGGGSKRITLDIIPPNEAIYEENGYKITFIATDEDDDLKSMSLELLVYIDPIYGVDLNIKKFKADVNKEEDAEYLIDVISKCNVKINIKLSILKIPSDWDAVLDNSIINLDPYQSTQVRLTVTPTKETSIDDVAEIEVEAIVLDINEQETSSKATKKTETTVSGDFMDKITEAVENLKMIFILLVMVIIISAVLLMRTGTEDWEDDEEEDDDEENKEEGEKDKDDKEKDENKKDEDDEEENDDEEDEDEDKED